MLENGIIPPAANFEKVNPSIPLEEWNIRIATEPTPWPSGIRRLSVNSFGFGGANAHVVLDDALSMLAGNIDGIHRTLPRPLLQTPNGHQTDVLRSANQRVNGNHKVNGDHELNGHAILNDDPTIDIHTNGSNRITDKKVLNGDNAPSK